MNDNDTQFKYDLLGKKTKSIELTTNTLLSFQKLQKAPQSLFLASNSPNQQIPNIYLSFYLFIFIITIKEY